MEQEQSEKSELASGEGANASAPRPPDSATTVRQLEANETTRALPTRRKLSDEQEAELTRLYAETTMPVSMIARMFGIGESSVYRLAQRHGAALRGRQTPPGVTPAKPAARGTRVATSPAKPPEAQIVRGLSHARARLRVRDTARGRFRIRFLVERVVQARDIRDALRQAESFDAIEVTAVMHED